MEKCKRLNGKTLDTNKFINDNTKQIAASLFLTYDIKGDKINALV